jgi:hypothetical protein
MDAIAAFREIVCRATDTEKSDPENWNLIPYAAELVATVHTYPQDQQAFEQEFISLVDDDSGPGGPFLEFCMHALRWDSVRLAIEKRHEAAIDRRDFRKEPYYRHLLESFDDDWGDANDLYASYFRLGT